MHHVGYEFPNQGSNPCSLHWECGALIPGQPGRSPHLNFFNFPNRPFREQGCLCPRPQFTGGETRAALLWLPAGWGAAVTFRALCRQRSVFLLFGESRPVRAASCGLDVEAWLATKKVGVWGHPPISSPWRQMAQGPWRPCRLWLLWELPWSLCEVGAVLILKTVPVCEVATWRMNSEGKGSAACPSPHRGHRFNPW